MLSSGRYATLAGAGCGGVGLRLCALLPVPSGNTSCLLVLVHLVARAAVRRLSLLLDTHAALRVLACTGSESLVAIMNFEPK